MHGFLNVAVHKVRKLYVGIIWIRFLMLSALCCRRKETETIIIDLILCSANDVVRDNRDLGEQQLM